MSETDDYYGWFITLAVALYLSAVVERWVYRSGLSREFWEFMRQHYKSGSNRRPGFPLLGMVAGGDTSGIKLGPWEWLTFAGQSVLLGDVSVARRAVPWKRKTVYATDELLDGTFTVRYIVMRVALGLPTPHIFIDGRSQNRRWGKNTDLWSLTKRLGRADRMHDLEGDFYKHFTVYCADKNYLDTLTIITPDVMLALRDQGHSFDYEIHNGYLYILHEPAILNSGAYQAFVDAATAAISELVPQIVKHGYTGTDKHLQVSNFKVGLWGMWYSCRWLAWFLCKAIVVLLLGLFLGDGLRLLVG